MRNKTLTGIITPGIVIILMLFLVSCSATMITGARETMLEDKLRTAAQLEKDGKHADAAAIYNALIRDNYSEKDTRGRSMKIDAYIGLLNIYSGRGLWKRKGDNLRINKDAGIVVCNALLIERDQPYTYYGNEITVEGSSRPEAYMLLADFDQANAMDYYEKVILQFPKDRKREFLSGEGNYYPYFAVEKMRTSIPGHDAVITELTGLIGKVRDPQLQAYLQYTVADIYLKEKNDKKTSMAEFRKVQNYRYTADKTEAGSANYAAMASEKIADIGGKNKKKK
jgi:hypothetical protein